MINRYIFSYFRSSIETFMVGTALMWIGIRIWPEEIPKKAVKWKQCSLSGNAQNIPCKKEWNPEWIGDSIKKIDCKQHF